MHCDSGVTVIIIVSSLSGMNTFVLGPPGCYSIGLWRGRVFFTRTHVCLEENAAIQDCSTEHSADES